MEMKFDYSDITFRGDGRLRLLIIVGTRPEIIRLSAVIEKCRRYFDCLLAHTGQNYDYNLNGVFFRDLGLADPDVYMNAVGDDLGAKRPGYSRIRNHPCRRLFRRRPLRKSLDEGGDRGSVRA